MSTCASFEVQLASVMEVFTRTAVAEITRMADKRSADLLLEINVCKRENEALKSKVLLLERELRASVRGYGGGTPDGYLNVSVKAVANVEFKKTQIAADGHDAAAESAGTLRIISGEIKDGENVPMRIKTASLDVLKMKCEPVDGERDWPKSLLLRDDWLEDDRKSSQSQEDQRNGEITSGASGAAAANCSEGSFCKEEELHLQAFLTGDSEKGLQAEPKLESEGQPLPPLGSAGGLEIQRVWSEASGSGKVPEKCRQLGVRLENDNSFCPQHYRDFQRLYKVRDEGLASCVDQRQNGCLLARDRSLQQPEVLPGMAIPPGSQAECSGSTPCEVGFKTSVEAKTCWRVEEREDFDWSRSWKTFTDTVEMKLHGEQQSMGKGFSCSERDKDFADSSILEKHQKIHCGMKTFTHSTCSKSFSQAHVLKTSKSTHARQPQESGKCFRYKRNLETHQSVRTRDKPFKCERCGKCISHKGKLKSHLLTHSQEKCLRCPVCNKTFAYLCVLKQHQKVHLGQKQLRCKECGKSFNKLSNLTCHYRVHTGEKPFCCPQCGKSFAQISNLNLHQRVHTQEKPFACEHCGRNFSRRSNLKAHYQVHAGRNTQSLHALQEFLPQ